MSNSLARSGDSNSGYAAQSDRGLPWAPLRDLLGFDPFQNIRGTFGYDYEVTRTENGYAVEVPVPGYGPSNVEVTFKDGVLTINGKTERRTFTRSFTIPEEVDTESIEARVQDGMLVLKLARRPEAQPKKIHVN